MSVPADTSSPDEIKLLSMALVTLALAAACSDDPRAALNNEWRQLMQCSAYYSLHASAAREGRTAAASRTASAAQADAALAARHSDQLAELAGRTPTDADAQSREIANQLWEAIDADLTNIGRLRAHYEESCRTTLIEAEDRTEYWRRKLR